MKYEAKLLRSGFALSLALMVFGSAHAQMMQARPAVSQRGLVAPTKAAIRTVAPTTFASPTSLFSQPCNTPSRFIATRTPCVQQFRRPRVVNCSPAGYSYPVIYPGYYYSAGYSYSDVRASYANSDDSVPSEPYVPSGPSNYYNWGRDWGQDLRRNVVTWEQFVLFCKEEIVSAAPEAIADFPGAFIEAYGTNGQAALDKALGEARSMQQQATAPKVITMSPKSGY